MRVTVSQYTLLKMLVRRRDVVAVALIGGSFVLGRCGAEQEVRYERVEVPVEVLLEREPDTVVSIVERVKYVNVPPVQIAVAPTAAQDAVETFCRPITVSQTVTDTVYVEPTLLLRSVSVDQAMWTGTNQVFLTGLLSDGGLMGADYKLRGSWSARVNADSIIVLQSRASWFRGALEFAIPLTAGLLLGGVL